MKPTNWHRLFGLLLTDFFTDSPYVVEMEKDLSLKKQLLDIVILRKTAGQFVDRLPDSFEDLTTHNLITFKSHQETLDDWAMKELTGHYVNYRKQESPSFDNLLPEDQFRLYAVDNRTNGRSQAIGRFCRTEWRSIAAEPIASASLSWENCRM